jgi:hypothetical protein
MPLASRSSGSADPPLRTAHASAYRSGRPSSPGGDRSPIRSIRMVDPDIYGTINALSAE